MIINTSKVIKIDILHNKYIFSTNNRHVDGFLFFGSGSIDSVENKIEICKNKNSNDYHIVKEWIDSL